MIDTHNKTLNASYDADERYKMWEQYRNDISQFITKVSLIGKSVLIVGAGNLNDIELKIFESCQVTLLDIDVESVERGILRQGFSLDEFTLIEGDLTGLNHTVFFEKLDETTTESLEAFKEVEIDIHLETYDIIVVLPIYTQLLLPQLVKLNLTYEGLNIYLPLIQNRIEKVNALLRHHIKDKGFMIVLSDVLEYNARSEEGQYLNANRYQNIILEEFYNSYLENFGHGLGSYGIYEMNKFYRTVFKDFFVWPFDSKRIMLIEAQIMKKNSDY